MYPKVFIFYYSSENRSLSQTYLQTVSTKFHQKHNGFETRSAGGTKPYLAFETLYMISLVIDEARNIVQV